MDLSAMKDLYIGSTPVQSAWLGGTKVWERKPPVDIQAIKDAMLLWYDLKRQGATNESMAATPELVNLAYDPDKAHVIDWTQFSTRGDGVQQFSIEITSTTNYWVINQGAYHRTNSIPSFYVEVANLPEGKVINYFYGNGSDERQTYAITYNGLHKLPACKISPNVTTATGFFISNEDGQTVADVVGTTITQVNPSLNATCYNFAWSGESGIGKYVQNAFIGSTYKFTEVSNGWCLLINNYNKDVSWKVKVTCADRPITLEDGIKFFYTISNEGASEFGGNLSDAIEDGKVITINPYTGTDNVNNLWINLNAVKGYEVVIEQIPEYPNALVADGVDDCAKVEGLPLLTDYTVIMKREGISIDTEGVTAVKGYTGMGILDNLFAIDIFNNASTYIYGSFGRWESLDNTLFTDTKIIEAVPYKINGREIYHEDDANQDAWPYLYLCGEPSHTRYNNIALYSFILFNRTLTEEEINWVKTNLIEGDTEL